MWLRLEEEAAWKSPVACVFGDARPPSLEEGGGSFFGRKVNRGSNDAGKPRGLMSGTFVHQRLERLLDLGPKVA